MFSQKKLPLYDFANLKEGNKEEYLLQNILENKYANDKEAIEDLYGSPKDAYKYRMLKSRLQRKLHNHLFFVYNDIRIGKKVENECLDMVYRGKTLLHIVDYELAENAFKKTLALSEKYEFTDITLECYQNLNYIYAQLSKYKPFYTTLNKLEKYKEIKSYEDEAYKLYYTAKLELNRSIASKKSYLIKLPEVILQLKQLWEKSRSFNVFQNYYYLNTWYYKLKGNYEESIKNLRECEVLLKKGKINPLRFDHRANKYSYISTLLKVHQYKKGLALAEEYLPAFDPYSRNWFAFMEYYFLLAMHAKNFKLANDLIFKVDSNPYFKRLKPRAFENWKLYKAYLFFIYDKTKYIGHFNFQEFIIDVPEHSKDKLGYNVSIHILQFLHYLKNKDYDQLLYQEEALRKYLNFYLKDINSERSRLFFRLLILSIRVEFDAKTAEKKGNLWLEKLKKTPTPGDAFAEIEIIPYETLWEIILKFMK